MLYQTDAAVVSANELMWWMFRSKQAEQARSQAEARKPGLQHHMGIDTRNADFS